MEITPKEYLDKMVDMCLVKISCMVRVKETDEIHCETYDFRLSKPEITIEVCSTPEKSKSFVIDNKNLLNIFPLVSQFTNDSEFDPNFPSVYIYVK